MQYVNLTVVRVGTGIWVWLAVISWCGSTSQEQRKDDRTKWGLVTEARHRERESVQQPLKSMTYLPESGVCFARVFVCWCWRVFYCFRSWHRAGAGPTSRDWLVVVAVICWLLFCGELTCVYVCVLLDERNNQRPGFWTNAVKCVCACARGRSVADVVQTWSCASDCCLHIYLHDFSSVCVCVCFGVCALCEWVGADDDWDGDSPKSTSEGCLTKTICLADGSASRCLTFSPFLIRCAVWRVMAVCLCETISAWFVCFLLRRSS